MTSGKTGDSRARQTERSDFGLEWSARRRGIEEAQ